MEKKMLLKKEDRKERRTVESYYCTCVCKCNVYNCNPCDSTPSTAYLARRDKYNPVNASNSSGINYVNLL